jgi:methyltransferase
VSWAILVVLLVAAERLAELRYAARNTRNLRQRGAIETSARHYPLIVLLHASWLIAIVVGAPPGPPLGLWLGVFLALQAARIWVIVTLGAHWTTRIITVPHEPLVRRGPYRFLRHPNYAVVVGEIAVLPLAFHEPGVALVFSALNLAILAWRIRAENRALAGRR